MSENTAASLKICSVSLMTLEVYEADLLKIEGQLRGKGKDAFRFFSKSPLLINLEPLQGEIDINWLKDLYTLLKDLSFLPVGISGTPEHLDVLAMREGIAVWNIDINTVAKKRDETNLPAPAKKKGKDSPLSENTEIMESAVRQTDKPDPQGRQSPEREKPPQSEVILQPVRSGQRIYAKDRDLIILAAVNTGAEVMADGNVHIYGPLRGRALAGVSGRRDARIFCQDLQADLVAIAGYYMTNEDLQEEKLNQAVQISLFQESLQIELLNH